MQPDRDRYAAYYAEKLWKLLPEVVRAEDSAAFDRKGPLRELCDRLGGQSAVLRRSLDRLWEDTSIEGCDAWAIAYLGDLLATNLVPSLDGRGRRLDVANTIYYRRRKGTPAVLEQLAFDITGWDARVVEFFRRLSRTQHGLDPAFAAFDEHAAPEQTRSMLVLAGRLGRRSGTPRGGTADLRSVHGARAAHGPFDEFAHTADVRLGRGALGRYNIPRLGLFVYRRKSIAVDQVTPVRDASCDNQFTFDPTGREIPLYARPNHAAHGDSWSSPLEESLPGPISRSLLENSPAELYASGGPVLEDPHSLALYSVSPSLTSLYELARIAADPRDFVQSPLALEEPDFTIDPERGRFFASDRVKDETLRVSYRYGTTSAIGAGGYDRRERGQNPERPEPRVDVSGGGGEFAGAALGTSGSVELADSLTYDGAPALVADGALVIAAANRARPLLRLSGGAALAITGVAGSRLVLDGLFVSGGDVVLSGSFEQVLITTSTLDPGSLDASGAGWALSADARSLAPTRLRIEGEVRRLDVDRSILGPVTLGAGGALEEAVIRRSIVQGELGESALALAGSTLELSGVTVLGKLEARQLEAENSILLDLAAISDYQHGCVRFSAWAEGSVLPKQYRSLAIDANRGLFVSQTFGHPGYAELLPSLGPALLEGSDGGSEMGAHCHELRPIKERSLLIKCSEYMPVGLQPVILHVT